MYTISFQSTHNAIKTKNIITNKNIKFNMIPTPRSISSSCGMSIQIIDNTDLDTIKDIIEQNQVSIYGIFDDNLEKVE